jgi:dynein intermediate chain 1
MKVTEISQLPAGIVALDYYNESATHYRVACDDGKVYHVLRSRTTQPPTVYDAHSPPILGLCYNRFHHEVYASCGTDWSVKLWREGETTPLQVYDFAPHYPTDCQFAPHSSTIIGTVTSEGELFVYDIVMNRYAEICKTEVVEYGDGGLTALRFHPKWPVLVIGDEKGRVHAVKMSPNLRRNTKTQKEEEERNKMTKSGSQASRGLLPELGQPAEDDGDDGGNAAAEEEARNEALAADESAKFVASMGVSWIIRPEVVSAIPAA